MSKILRGLTNVPVYMRSPSWRWNVAIKCLIDPTITAEEEIRLARRAGDEMLVEACCFYRHREDVRDRNPQYLAKFPAMYEAFQLFSHTRSTGSFRWWMEAMMMTNATDAEIAQEFQPLHGEATIKRFRAVFFDVESYKSIPAKLFCTVLANALEKTHHETPCDFTWKIIAYQHGPDAFREFYGIPNGWDYAKTYATVDA